MKSIGSGIGFNFDAITSFVHKGSFPELHENESDLHDWADFYSFYLQTYIEKDIKDVLNIKKYICPVLYNNCNQKQDSQFY
jgi:hypothetical protein